MLQEGLEIEFKLQNRISCEKNTVIAGFQKEHNIVRHSVTSLLKINIVCIKNREGKVSHFLFCN